MIIYTLQWLTQHDMFILGKFWKDRQYSDPTYPWNNWEGTSPA
jgi:hypothetical protein